MIKIVENGYICYCRKCVAKSPGIVMCTFWVRKSTNKPECNFQIPFEKEDIALLVLSFTFTETLDYPLDFMRHFVLS